MEISYWESLTDDEQAVLVESALARSQCAVQLAIDGAGITQTELARRLTLEQGNISLRLSGRHGMSVRISNTSWRGPRRTAADCAAPMPRPNGGSHATC